ncbi:MAG TPA: M14 family metallopeptidase [Pyrinomonadaceae bacterium]|nr:M14 family metallopeptidase [Pyrinomonadaceae bacterium]
MRTRLFALILALSISLPFLTFELVTAQRPRPRPVTTVTSIPSPRDVLGFTPGDDRKLASWNQVLNYFDKLDRASDRVKFEALGKTTMDVPFVMATISAPENLARLEDYKHIQQLLADPRKLGAPAARDRKAAELIGRGKTIVLITFGIHSTEVGSYLSSMLIAHRLASSNEPEIQNILKNTIILLVPSLNPDGVDIVKKWYDKTLGTPFEGTNPPKLYHKYVGHDNNRDWYAFTQVETQITVSKIHNVWHPQIVHDIHQQGEFGSRLFLPPYMPPVEPNVPKQIVEGYTELGNWMAAEMRRAGFKGITTGSTYDAWTPARAYSHYHGGVRILSETASARLATPITVKFEELRSREGYDPQKESDKFGPLWRGGEWRLRDITNYMTTGAFTLMTHAAQNRERWLSRFYEVGKEAVRPRRAGELFGYLLPPNENLSKLLEILDRGGVTWEVTRRFKRNGVAYPEHTYIVPMAQPYGNFAKALLEPQRYPNLLDPAGHPIPPYDVTAHTLPLLMNVTAEPVFAPFRYSQPRQIIGGGGPAGAMIVSKLAVYHSHVPSMDEGWTRWILKNQSLFHHSTLNDREVRLGNLRAKLNTIILPDQLPRTILNGHLIGIMPTEYTGGLGAEGVKTLLEFVEQGGTLVCLNRASDFVIEQFKLPLRNVVAGVSEKEFFVPGSILRIELDTSHPITRGMKRESIAWVEDSPVFEIVDRTGTAGQKVRVIASYPSDKNPLLSGWLLGADRLKGKAALVEVEVGKGRIILFGFRPQYRAQSLATYPLFFNALKGRE